MAQIGLKALLNEPRTTTHSDAVIRGDPRLGALEQLKGTWVNIDPTAPQAAGHMWNMIALPFGPAPQFPMRYRLLLNQGNELLRFSVGDLGVPNRGDNQNDQKLAALMYIQEIDQIIGIDSATGADGAALTPATPDDDNTPKGAVGIHRESGIFMRIGNLTGPCDALDQPGPNIGRLASVPHGDGLLAMGFEPPADPILGAPDFDRPDLQAMFSAAPVGLGNMAPTDPYLAPYAHFQQSPFMGVVDPTKVPGFPGFDPLKPLRLLKRPLGTVINHIELKFDSQVSGAVVNIPFITCQASATQVTSVFWIQEVDIDGVRRFVLQYAQRVMLEFHSRIDGQPGLIQWPHITINSMVRLPDPPVPPAPPTPGVPGR